MKTIVGVVLAAIVMFFYGFLYWGGIYPLPMQALQRADDDVAMGVALRQYLPATGTYYLPAMTHDADRFAELHEAGPVAMIHFIREGRPAHDMATMGKGFLLNLAVAGTLAMILLSARSALPSYLSRVRMAGLAGLAGMILIDVGSVVWWHISWEWKLHGAVYDLTVCIIAGLVLAAFIKPDEAGEAEK